MSKPTKATKIIHEAANRFKATGLVDWNSAYSTVCISSEGEDDIFMQGDEAEDFISEIERLCKKYPSLDEYTAACALSEHYTECIWG